ncbi:DNA polymerase III subunit delta' [Derxia gummosa]|uniref:DNA polymerase III subunit delta' n=1 Tax=Derxia gummosa DSM 723 TaxID=1121388 RepID=A0A8B6X7W5_9BURK|nr:DNA polymerase III subunit delta' [Derxia gummosa]
MSAAIQHWQAPAFARLAELRERGNWPHALLLHGKPGTGRRGFAQAVAAALLCETPAAPLHACGQCVSCRLIAAGSHPDLKFFRSAWLEQAEGDAEAAEASDDGEGGKRLSREITVDTIRRLADFASLASHRGGQRVALLYPADAMNNVAANTLLKTLEEPPHGLLFVLVADTLDRLLPTVRSRCQAVALPAPDAAAAAGWWSANAAGHDAALLALCDNAPFIAQALAQSPAAATAVRLQDALAEPDRLDIPGLARAIENDIRKLEREMPRGGAGFAADAGTVIAWLQSWMHDLVALGVAGGLRYHPARSGQLARLAARTSPHRALDYVRWLTEAARHARQPLGIALFLEDCLGRYVALFREGRNQ